MGAHAYATATVEASVPMLTADPRARHAAGETVLVGYSVADGYVYATDEGQVRMVTPEGETDITVRLGGAVPQPGQWVWLLASVVAA